MNRRRILSFALILLLWQILALIVNKPVLLPTVTEVLETMMLQTKDPSFFAALFATVGRMMKGLVLSALLALVLGVLCGLNEKLEDLFSSLQDIIKTIPNVSYIILALVWLGSERSITMICFFILFPNLYSSVLLGMKSLPKDQKQSLMVFPAPLWSVITKVYLPHMFPHFVSGLKVAFGMGFKVSVMAEILGAVQTGLGRKISYARTYVEIDDILAYTVWIILISLIVEKLFDLLLFACGYRKEDL